MKPVFITPWISALSRPTMPAFSALYTMEPLARSIIITVIPLMALEQFGSAQNVSFFFFVLGTLGVVLSLSVPWLVRKIRRRGTFTLGVITGIAAMLLFLQGDLWSLCAGMAIHLFAAACIDIAINLYMMEHIHRQDFGRFEPIRVFCLAFAWSIGPFLGVYLRNSIDPHAPFIFGIVAILMLALYFYYLRFTDKPSVPGKRQPVTNPLKYLPRFFQQPRLRLAYTLSLMRAGWWTMYFIYVPIYCVTSGLGENIGGAVVSVSTLFVMTTPLWRRPLQKIGMRYVLYIGLFGAGIMTVVISFFMADPVIAISMMLTAAFFAVPIDAVGNAPFFRAVHSYERSEMATVFSSYRAVGSLTFPGIYSGVLAVFQLPAVFAVTGICMIATGLMARFIPRKMK